MRKWYNKFNYYTRGVKVQVEKELQDEGYEEVTEEQIQQ